MKLLTVFLAQCWSVFVCREAFSPVIQDAEELDEAVQYLHNQGGACGTRTQHTARRSKSSYHLHSSPLSSSSLAGTILHFPDASLQSTYFLDPQWLTKMMANFIGPSKLGDREEANIRDGKLNCPTHVYPHVS